MVEHANRLIAEKSPYLLQHAHNPVDWYPWGEEAFALARTQDRPIFLSIGYSTCHWCHVMAHESFEDPQVAALLNAAFVNVKVDREERPDLDEVYMSAAQLLSGRGGWPLTIIMTPDKVPFFAATYLPKTDRFGQPGLVRLIPAVQDAWRNRRGQLLDTANQVRQALQTMAATASGALPGEGALHAGFEQLQQRYDPQFGGFGPAPKFPTPHNLLFLLRYFKRAADKDALATVEHTLRAMRAGDMYDQLGWGFHRYSTDDRWLLPHFEKMLYDQALLTMAYVEGYQATGNISFRETAEQVIAYVLRDLTSPDGAFFSAEDADSEGREGKFYAWTFAELQQVLGAEDANFCAQAYGVEAGGNFVEHTGSELTGENVLYQAVTPETLAQETDTSVSSFLARLERCRERLLTTRARRVRLQRDDKVLADWNGLMIAALARAGRALGNQHYSEAAGQAAAFVLREMRGLDGRLWHRHRDGQSAVHAFAADYAAMAWGLIDLYQATLDPLYLRQALELNRIMLADFWDDGAGGVFSTGALGESLLVRQKELYDGAIPSANSMAMLNLLRLGHLTGDTALLERAESIARLFSEAAATAPSAHTWFLSALDLLLGPAAEVVIAGKAGSPDTQALLTAVARRYLPNAVVLLHTEPHGGEIEALAPFVAAQRSVENRATAYVCTNFACQMPVTTPEGLLSRLA